MNSIILLELFLFPLIFKSIQYNKKSEISNEVSQINPLCLIFYDETNLCKKCVTEYFANIKGICQRCMENCVECYDENECKKCQDKFIVKKGKCEENKIYPLIIFFVFSGIFFACMICVCVYYYKRRKKNSNLEGNINNIEEISRRHGIPRQNTHTEMISGRPFTENMNTTQMRENNENLPTQSAMINSELVQVQKKEENIIKIPKPKKKIFLCVICNNEASFVLNCQCYFCKEDIKNYYDVGKNETIKELKKLNLCCPNCREKIMSVDPLIPKCGICLEEISEVYNFPCGCNNLACLKCYKKCIVSTYCPFCKRKIL